MKTRIQVIEAAIVLFFIVGVGLQEGRGQSAPLLQSPANNAIHVPISPTLAWGTVAGTNQYTLRYATTSSMTGAASLTTTATSLALSNLSFSTQYYWEVVANVGGVFSTSARWSFSTMPCPPTITAQPQSNNIACLGGSTTLSVTATGANLTYHWRRNGTFINGATSRALTLTNLTFGDSGSYDVFIFGTCSPPAQSNIATLVIEQTPTITQQPLPIVACLGTSISFTVAAGGTNLQYQWFRNDIPVAGATSATYSIPSLQSSHPGNYRCRVFNGCNEVFSQTVPLTLLPATAIMQQPSSLTVCAGASALFSVTATGANLTYQWRRNGQPISGATARQLLITNARQSDLGGYSVVIGSSCLAPVESAAATLSLYPTIDIQAQPQPQSICLGGTAQFHIQATGASLTYQWRRNGQPIAGAHASGYTVPFVSSTTAGQYDVLVSDVCGRTVTSASTLLTLNTAPAITSQPTPVVVCRGGQATFSVAAGGTGPLGYQWRRDGVALVGATSPTLTVSDISNAKVGQYDCVVSNHCNPTGLASDPASLTMHTPPEIIAPPAANSVVCRNSSIALSVQASGTSLSYQWRRNGVNLQNGIGVSGVNSPTLTLTPSGTGFNGNYDVLILGGGQCAPVQITSPIAALVVDTLTQLTGFPVGLPPNNILQICEGYTLRLGVRPAGDTLTYLWSKIGNAPLQNSPRLQGVEADTLIIHDIVPADAGTYRVSVTTRCGRVITRDVQVQVQPRTRITAEPLPLVRQICETQTLQLSVGILGTTPASYQWRHNGIPLSNSSRISGANSLNLTISQLQLQDNGTYDLVLTSSCGGVVTSASVTVEVLRQTRLERQITPSFTLCEGEQATMSAGFSGVNVNYYWEFNGGVLLGAQDTILQFNNAQPAQSGLYRLIAFGQCGDTIRTAYCTLTVLPKPSIVSHPVSYTQCETGNAFFAVQATGASLTYRWRRNGVPLSNGGKVTGADAHLLQIADIAPAEAGNYDVLVQGVCSPDTLISQVAILTVQRLPRITTQPIDTTVCAGQAASFSITATGDGLQYRWFKDGIMLTDDGTFSGTTQATLSIATATNLDQAGMYRVELTGVCGTSILSDEKQLTLRQLPTISSIEAPQVLCQGDRLTMTANVTGAGISMQWYKDETPLPNQTNAVLTIENMQPQQSGIYSLIVQGICQPPARFDVPLTVHPTTSIVQEPQGGIFCAGATAAVTLEVTGASLVYQWYKNSLLTPIIGANTPTLLFNNLSSADSGSYFALVAGECGVPIMSTAAHIAVSDVNIAQQPAAVTVCEGGNANFSVQATAPTLSYQWFKNGQPIAGATEATFSLAQVPFGDNNATFEVLINGSCRSNAATLTVHQRPLMSVENTLVLVCEGGSTALTVAAEGDQPLQFQWWHNGMPLAGVTSPTLTLTGVTSGNYGLYSLQVISVNGCETFSPIIDIAAPEGVFIVAQPQNTTLCQGENLTLNVGTSGQALQYRWFRNQQLVVEQSSPSLTIEQITPEQAGVYTVEIVGNCQTVTSAQAVVQVLPAPHLTTPLGNRTLCPDEATTFIPTFQYAGNFTFSWILNGSLLSNSASFSYQAPLNPTTETLQFIATSVDCPQLQYSTTLTISVVDPFSVAILASTQAIRGVAQPFALSANFPTQWAVSSPSGVLTSQGSGASVLWTAAGTFSVSATVQSDCGMYTTTANVEVLLLNPPEVIAPADGAQHNATSITLEWQTAPNATGYRVQISTHAHFSEIIADITTSSTSLLVENLENGGTYYWRVQSLWNGIESPIAAVAREFTVQTLLTQIVQLNTNWNQVGLYVKPLQNDAAALLGSSPFIVLARNQHNPAQMYFPTFWGNTLTNVTHRTPLQIFSIAPEQIPIVGEPVNADTVTFNLEGSGWFAVPYIKTTPLQARSVALTVGTNFILLRSQEGSFYFAPSHPLVSFNTMTAMEVGKSYQVFISDTVAFSYPAQDLPRSGSERVLNFQPLGKFHLPESDNFMTLLCTLPEEYNGSDIVVATASGNLVGAGRVVEGKAAVQIFGQSNLPNSTEGAAEGERLYVEISTGEGNVVIAPSSVENVLTKEKEELFRFASESVIYATFDEQQTPPTEVQLRLRPIPAVQSLTVEYTAYRSHNAHFSITNLLGREVLQREEFLTKGKNSIVISVDNLPPGAYILHLQDGERVISERFLIAR